MRTSIVVAAVLSMLGAVFLGLASSQEQEQEESSEQVVEVSAERFSFTPSRIEATVGTTLEIRLRSEDTAHGFRILGTDLNVEIPKRGRGTRVVRYTPEEAGKLTFECSKLCGAGHAFMRGEIIVREPGRQEP